MHSLPIFVKLNGRKVVLVGTGEAADAKARLIERAGGIVVREDDADNAALAFVALEDEGDARAAVERLRGRDLLVNAVDRPGLCDFTTPAIVDRSPVLIAIATGGASAGLAKAIRQRIEAMLPANLGQLADGMKAARDAIKARWPGAAERRRAIDAALAPAGALDPLSDVASPPLPRIAKWIENGSDHRERRIETVTLISDDPDDLTLRTSRLLGEADHVVHPPGLSAVLLVRARADAVRHEAPCEMELLEGLIVCLRYDANARDRR